MSVKLKAKLPTKSGRDGLQRYDGSLREHSEDPFFAVVCLVPSAVTENLLDDEDPYTVTLAITAIESPGNSNGQEALRSILDATFEQRTGKAPLPFDGDEGVDVTDVVVDPVTGEIIAHEDWVVDGDGGGS